MNNYGFEILRSAQNDNWEKIGFVQGHGNSNSPKEYSFIDSPQGGTKFKYRLKQIDFDGAFEYSDVVEVNFNAPVNFVLDQNYPNPFNPTSTIRYDIPKTSFVKIQIYDLLGREVAVLVNEEKSAGNYSIKFNGSNLTSGVYLYRMQAGGFVETKKLILIK